MTIFFDKNILNTTSNIKNDHQNFVAGKVSFVVDKADEKHSDKSGYYMVARLSVINEQKQTAKVNVFLFFTDKSIYRVDQFCKSVGEPNLLHNGQISADAFTGLEGKAIVKKGMNGYLEVVKFLPKNNTPVLNNSPALNNSVDDIPF